MGSAFETMFGATAWPVLSSMHGESVTYTPNTGAPATVTAIVSGVSAAPQVSRDGKQHVWSGKVLLQPSDAPTPDQRDRFTIGGVAWGCSAAPSDSKNGTVAFAIERREQVRLGGGSSYVRR